MSSLLHIFRKLLNIVQLLNESMKDNKSSGTDGKVGPRGQLCHLTCFLFFSCSNNSCEWLIFCLHLEGFVLFSSFMSLFYVFLFSHANRQENFIAHFKHFKVFYQGKAVCLGITGNKKSKKQKRIITWLK